MRRLAHRARARRAEELGPSRRASTASGGITLIVAVAHARARGRTDHEENPVRGEERPTEAALRPRPQVRRGHPLSLSI